MNKVIIRVFNISKKLKKKLIFILIFLFIIYNKNINIINIIIKKKF